MDRKVSGRTPAALNKGPHVDDAEELCVVGHPVGLPQKYACNAAILSNESEIFFSASLDTYGGNSGSMVFSAKTGMVQGILVRGETDFVYDTENECARSMVCPDHGCRGEDVTRISRILSALESSCRR